jgi:hypothetical protein
MRFVNIKKAAECESDDGITDDEDVDGDENFNDGQFTNDVYAERSDTSSKMVTGVRILKSSALPVLTETKRKRRPRKAPSAIVGDEQVQERKDLVAFAVRKARQLCDSHVVCVRNALANMEEYNDAEEYTTKPRPRGWARRPAHGKQYGCKYISIYERDIIEFFNQGKETSAEKLSPAHMLQLLKQKYPGVFRFPSETEIRQEVSALFQKSKKAAATSAGTGTNAGAQNGIDTDNRRVFPQPVEDKITLLLQSNTSLKTAEVIAMLKQEFGNNIASAKGGILSQQQLTSKVASIRNRITNSKGL